jgi:hypothetical protein
MEVIAATQTPPYQRGETGRKDGTGFRIWAQELHEHHHDQFRRGAFLQEDILWRPYYPGDYLGD